MPDQPQNDAPLDVTDVMRDIRRRALELPDSGNSAAHPAAASAAPLDDKQFADLQASLQQANRVFTAFQQRLDIIKHGYALDPSAWNRLRGELSGKFGDAILPPPGTGIGFQLKRITARCMRFFFGAQESYNQQMRFWLDELFTLNAGLLGALNSLPVMILQQSSTNARHEEQLLALQQQRTQIQQTLLELKELTNRFETESAAHTLHIADTGRQLHELAQDYRSTRTESITLARNVYATLEQIRSSLEHQPGLPAGPAIEREARLKQMLNEGNAIEDFDFLDWESRTRGAEENIKQQQDHYSTIFIGRQDVLDIGCGRGEFLELLAARGIRSRGVDLDSAMVRHCQQKGLNAIQANALDYLVEQHDASLGGIFAAQVVEHLTVTELSQLCRQAFRVLRPGAPILLETQNPMCLTIFSGAFFADPTHVKPVHPEALRFFLERAGFRFSAVHFSAEVPAAEKLELLEQSDDPQLARLTERLNANLAKLNSVLYTHAHYAALAHKPE